MKRYRITEGGQVSIPAEVRRRWATQSVALDDHGSYLVVRPVPTDPIGAARGRFRGRVTATERLRAEARADEARAGRS
jgi:bifunctional DNA-binding transcriptional regulator/antitoxin component of YhaV-PrlF toxin-antitoxin module